MEYTLEEVFSKIDRELPALSPTAGKVMQLANNINCSPTELTKVIKLDPVLSLKVMRLVNSSYFNVSQKVMALEKAVIMLGLNTIKNLALSAAMMSQMKPLMENSALDIDGFWRYSLGVGVAAKSMALKADVDKKLVEDYFLAGLIHAFGLLIECSVYREEAEEFINLAPAMGLVEAEEYSMCGLSHLQIGAMLSEKWGLPANLREVMAHYNEPGYAGEGAQLVLTIGLASIICKNNNIGLSIDKTPLTIDSGQWEKIGLTASVEEEVVAGLGGEIDKATEFLNA